MNAKTRQKQLQTTLALIDFDASFGCSRLCGVDEAGRGPLVGPVTVCACVMPTDVPIIGVNDSKKLTEARREELFEKLIEVADYCVVSLGRDVIDSKNILQATKQGMAMALSGLRSRPDHAIIDAVKGLDTDIPYTPVIKADAKSYATAAASIIAKVTRDRYMRELDARYPQYGFLRNKGYGTAEHIEALKRYGATPEHRLSFIKNFFPNGVYYADTAPISDVKNGN